MSPFLRAIDDARLREREANLRDTRGAELPRVELDKSLPAFRESSAAARRERLERIVKLRRLGMSADCIAEALGLTVRQVRRAEAAP